MIKIIFIPLFIVSLMSGAFSGEKPPIHLTGNRTVDFFGNVKDYSGKSAKPAYFSLSESFPEASRSEKSPWLAGLLSFVVPGAGEFYSESYLKAGLFFGIEVASIFIAASYNSKGNRQTDFFEAYANEHYSPVRYAQWLYNYVEQLNPAIDPSQYELFYGNPNPECGPPFPCLDWVQLNRLEYAIGGSFTHRLPYYGEQQYYELIGKYKQFSKGWDDEPDEFDHTTPEERYYYYAKEFNLADKYYNIASSFIAVAVANHILSALDAAWSASRYNKNLHAEVNLQLQQSPIGFVPMARAKLIYSF